MNVGIVGFGTYLPFYRIKVSEIAPVWGKNPDEIEKSLGVSEKAVASYDEDALTMAFEAASSAIAYAGIDTSLIQLCLVGSESHPYAVNPTSTIVSEFLGMKHDYIASDLEFACKAGTTGMIAAAGLIASKKVKYALCIGSDTAQSKPHDILEYTSASAACAFILGEGGRQDCIAQLIDFSSFSSDTPDFWRRDGVRYPSHGGRFTGEPAYFSHVIGATTSLLQKTGMKPSDFDYCIFHTPNGKFPREVARRLGFAPSQMIYSLTVDTIGNPYSASSLLGLANVLSHAKSNQMICMVSYGSGAGSDGFVFQTTKNISKKKVEEKRSSYLDKKKKYISYLNYLKYSKKI